MQSAPANVVNRGIQSRCFTFAVLVFGCVAACCGASADAVGDLRAQLKSAESAENNAATAELARRIVDANPRDAAAWETLARAWIALQDKELSGASLDQFERAVRPPPAVIEDLRGDFASEAEDHKAAEQHWLAYVRAKPPAAKAAATYDKLADLFVEQSRWRDVLEMRTRALAAEQTAERRVLRATALMRLRDWTNAFAQMQRANALDPADATVEEWLPQFDRLGKFLPKIKMLDAQISKTPANATLWLDRARLFTVAERPLLALEDCEEALRLQPASMRARIQKGEALLDDQRTEDAVKIAVAVKLARGEGQHVSERALRDLGAYDALIIANPRAAAALAARAKVLRNLNQFTLALDDARAALAIEDNLAAAHFEAAHALDELGNTKEALVHIVRSTELDRDDPVKWYYRGLLESNRANFEAAIESQTRSISIRESVVALRVREQSARRIGQVDRANADLRRIEQLEPAAR